MSDTRTPDPAGASFAAIGTTALVLVTDPAGLPVAERILRGELDALDDACSRFRADSEISRLLDRAGSWQPVSPLLAEALAVALRAAKLTDGLVDPTVGTAVAALGYDRDFDEVVPDDPRPVIASGPVPGWWRIQLDRDAGAVLLPRGIDLDLGATAKAFAADRAAALIAAATGCGVLVSLGGDIAVTGPAPEGGWRIGVGDDHARPAPADPVVTVVSGGLATSTVARRAWRRGGRGVHHIVDPRTGDAAVTVWRTASVAAGTCVDANTASTAAIVLGDQAPSWLAAHGLPARLVDPDGRVVVVAGWPDDPRQEAGRWSPAGTGAGG